MIFSGLFTVVLSVGIAFSVYFVVILLSGWSQNYLVKQRLAARLANFAQIDPPLETVEVVKAWQTPINNWLKTRSGSRFGQLVTQARLRVSPLAAASNTALVMLTVLVFGMPILGSIVSTIILTAGVYFIVVIWLRQKKMRYEQRFIDQLPQALDLIANALRSSSSLVQAIEHAVRESEPPIKNELLKVVEHLGVGMNLDQALDKLYQELPVPEMEFLISAIIIQRRIGSNLAKLLTKASELLREKIELKNELMVQTAQARLSGRVIGLMPVVVVGFLMLADPGFIAPLFTTSLGVIFLVFAGLAELVGFLLIRKVLDVEF